MTGSTPPARDRRTRINIGLGRLLIFVYALFTLSAGARAIVEIATKYQVAPLAYALSALAAVVYLVATICLTWSTPVSRRIAIACCTLELLFVLAVGIATIVDSSAFPDKTVWSGFGYQYGYVPLLLPVVGLWWLARGAPGAAGPGAGGTGTDTDTDTDTPKA